MIKLMTRSIVAATLLLTLSLQNSFSQEETESTAAVIKFSPTHKLILTSTDGIVGVERKAFAIQKIIEQAPNNTVLHLVFRPTQFNSQFYNQLTAMLSATINDARRNRNVKVRTQLVNPEIAQASFEAFSEINQIPLDQAYLNYEAAGLLTFDDVPKNLVERLNRNSSVLSNMWGVTRDAGKTISNAVLNDTSFSGLVLATSLTGLGYTTLGPSYVYVSEGEWSLGTILNFALSTALLYTIPRHENLTQKVYEVGYEITRSIKESLLYVIGSPFRYFSNLKYYLSEASPMGFNIFKATMGVTLYSFAVQSTFFYLQDGSAIWNPEYFEYMVRTSVLLGAASSPWSIATDKLKTETEISPNLVSHLRTAQLVYIGHLAASIQTAVEAQVFPINQDEAKLIGLGAAGLLVNHYGVAIVNKSLKNPWVQFVNQNFEALTNAPGLVAKNILRKLSGRPRLAYGFTAPDDIDQTSGLSSNQCIGFLAN